MNSPQAETSKGLILVVDDSQVTRYRITNFFREINYETVEAAMVLKPSQNLISVNLILY
jgi:CheY-like chemotaxis protein